MSDTVLLMLCMYLWLVGGLFITIATVNADFHGVPRKNIAALTLLWPLICLWAIFVVTGLVAMTHFKKWRARHE